MTADRRGDALAPVRRWVILGLLIPSCTSPNTPHSDPEMIELREAPCEGCRIELKHIVELGSDRDSSSVAEDALVFPCGVTSFRSDGFASARLTGGGEVGVYDIRGTQVGTVGRTGKGPGELGRDLRVLPQSSGGVAVVDNGNYRISVFDSLGALLHGFRIPGRALSHAALPDGRILIHTRPVGGGGPKPKLFHLFSQDGTPEGAFGDPDLDMLELDQWIVSAASDGGFFTTSIWSYEIWKWAHPDSLQWRVTRSAEWFPNREITPAHLEGLYVEAPPPPVMTHVLDTGDGLLWVLAMVPDQDWKKGPLQSVTPEWTRSTLDMIIEVIDLADARVLATIRQDEVAAPMCNQETLFTVRRTASGDTRVVILKPELHGWPE